MTTLALVGDVFLDRADPASAFAAVQDAFHGCDAAVGNLEGAVSELPVAPAPKYSPRILNFRSRVRQLDALGGLPFAAFGLANNHALDFGVASVEDTVSHLRKRGIATAGFGRDQEEAFRAAVFDCGRTRVAFLAVTCVFHHGWQATDNAPGMAAIGVSTSYEVPERHAEQPGTPPVVRTRVGADSADRLAAALRQARAAAGTDGLVVVGVHWGISGASRPLEYQLEIAGLCAAQSADVLFGHGPHTVQAVGFSGTMPVFYSLGNFLMDLDLPTVFGSYGALVRLPVGDARPIELVPVFRDGAALRMATSDEVARVARTLGDSSAPFGAKIATGPGHLVLRRA